MVKKITHIVAALLVLITSVGFSVSKHYCNNQLRNVVISKTVKTCCPTEDGCCKTETVLFSLKENAVGNAPVFVPTNVITSIQAMAIIHLLSLLVDIEPVKEIVHEYISPPPRKIQTVLSLVQSYRL